MTITKKNVLFFAVYLLIMVSLLITFLLLPNSLASAETSPVTNSTTIGWHQNATGTYANLLVSQGLSNVEYFTSSGTYTKKADVKFIIVELVGGGGGTIAQSSATKIGGDGASGIVIVWEYK